MSMQPNWTEADHTRLATLFDGVITDAVNVPYSGYKPEIAEVPNGDTKPCPRPGCASGRQYDEQGYPSICCTCNGAGLVPNVDAGPAGKRYLHVAPKYNPPQWAADYYDRAFALACRVATALGVPAAYRPHEAYCALRVIEYPSAGHRYCPAHTRKTIVQGCSFRCEVCRWSYDGQSWPPKSSPCLECGAPWSKASAGELCPALAAGAGTAEHTDPDLFTVPLWRSHPGDLELTLAPRPDVNSAHWKQVVTDRARAAEGLPAFTARGYDAASAIAPGLHIGRLGELVGLGPATPHRVPARPYVQKSIVFFAIPDWAARLPADGKPRSCVWCCGSGITSEHEYQVDTCGSCKGSGCARATVGEWLVARIGRSRVRK